MVNARSPLANGLAARPGSPPAEWRVERGLLTYDAALTVMDARVADIAAGRASELVWLVEHPPLYTAGTSAGGADLLDVRFPVHQTGRGGQMTYHGPGQRVVYLMLDLKRRRQDVRAYVATLEEWIIRALLHFNVIGERRDDRVGVWVRRPDKGPGHEDKIAAIGIRLKSWVSLHGLAINVEPDLSHFSGIVPCGVREQRYGVTSLVDLGLPMAMADLDAALKTEFEPLFGALHGGDHAETLRAAAQIEI
ncbi:MAG: lipoyl(octanoyl) transferase LipB [Pseudorhodoplanes sp.]|uniref:lipoyl(octanoyl) transferase LipB n=1 Tax=Pseudorhodoplanes sp. TaxID=1934341 RepID=UPI003D0FA456